MNGIFTTIKIVDGEPLFLDRHVERLSKNKDKRLKIKESIQEFINTQHIINAAFRIDALDHRGAIFKVRDLPQSGILVKAITLKFPTLLPTMKQIDRTIYEQAQKCATEKRADRAIFKINRPSGKPEAHPESLYNSKKTERFWTSQNDEILKNSFLLESTISNIISLDNNREMITPLLITQGYKGVMREALLERKYIKEKEIPLDTNGPLVLINSLRIEGVTHLDGRKLRDPKKLMEQLEKLLS